MRRFAFLLAVSILSSTCGGGGGNGGSFITASKGGSVCAAQGSAIAGACLSIPPNALSADTEISLTVGDELLASPSVAIGSTVSISPAGTQLSKAATLTVPYKNSLVPSGDSIQKGMVLRKNGELTRPFGNGVLTIDSAAQTIKLDIDLFAAFQPGFKVERLAVGDIADVPMGKSAGNFRVDLTPGQKFLFFLTPLPSGLDTAPDASVASYDFTISAPSGSNLKFGSVQNRLAQTSELLSTRDLFEQRLRQREQQIIQQGKLNWHKNSGRHLLPSFRAGGGLDFSGGATSGPDIGEVVSVKMLNVSGSGTVTYNAVVKDVSTATSPVVVYLVDQLDSSTLGIDTQVSKLKSALENNVLTRLRTFFGDFSDVDGDGRIAVVMSSRVSGGILGFFDAANLFEFRAGGETASSNEADVVFAAIPSDSCSGVGCENSCNNNSKPNQELLQSTICHELQHLINFTQKTLNRLVDSGQVGNPDSIPASTPFEEPFLNEGMSYEAEMLCGFGPLDAGPEKLTDAYLKPTSNYVGQAVTSLIDNASSVSLKVRGANFLFNRYLFEQTGGATAASGAQYNDNGGATYFKELLSSAEVGVKNYNRTFAAHDSLKRDFETAWRDYMIAVFNNGQSVPLLSSNRFNFSGTTVDNTTCKTVGININAVTSGAAPAIDVFSNGSSTFSGNVKSVAFQIVRYGVPSGVNGVQEFSISSPSTTGNLQARVLRVE